MLRHYNFMLINNYLSDAYGLKLFGRLEILPELPAIALNFDFR